MLAIGVASTLISLRLAWEVLACVLFGAGLFLSLWLALSLHRLIIPLPKYTDLSQRELLDASERGYAVDSIPGWLRSEAHRDAAQKEMASITILVRDQRADVAVGQLVHRFRLLLPVVIVFAIAGCGITFFAPRVPSCELSVTAMTVAQGAVSWSEASACRQSDPVAVQVVLSASSSDELVDLAAELVEQQLKCDLGARQGLRGTELNQARVLVSPSGTCPAFYINLVNQVAAIPQTVP